MSARWERMRLAWQVTGSMDTIKVAGRAAESASVGSGRTLPELDGSKDIADVPSSERLGPASASSSLAEPASAASPVAGSAHHEPLRLNAADLSGAELAALETELRARRAGRRVRRPRVRFESIRSTLVNSPQANFSFTNRIPLAHLQEIMVDVWHETGLA